MNPKDRKEIDMSAQNNVTNGNASDQKGRGEPVEIRAKDILACDFVLAQVVCVHSGKSVREIAMLLAEKKISAVPVVDSGELVGIVSEGDLLQRHELGTEVPEPVLKVVGTKVSQDKYFGTHACDIMSRKLFTVSEDATLAEIVKILLVENIRRVLVTRNEKLVGVVSRSDIVHVLAARPEGVGAPMSHDDDIIRFKVIEILLKIPGATPWSAVVNVKDRVVEISGSIQVEDARGTSRIAIESIPGVVEVRDRRSVLQPF